MNFIYKTVLFQTLLAAVFAHFSAAQCPGDDLIFNYQSEIDSFPILYPNCKSVNHRVSINSTPPFQPDSDIHNLNGLLGIDSIGEHLWITSKYLKNLHGLDSLKFVGGSLYLITDSLENLEGLGQLEHAVNLTLSDKNFNQSTTKGIENLRTVQSIDIYAPHLVSLEGFTGLDSVGAILRLDGAAISDLSGLENLRIVTDFGVYLLNLPRLQSLSGLDKLDNSGLFIKNCDSLVDLQGMPALKTAYFINLEGNERLESLQGLETLERIEWFAPGGLVLKNNPKLTDLSALDRPVPMPFLQIENNAALSLCSVQSICDFLVAPDIPAAISGNLTGCDSAEEILANCSVASKDFIEKTAFEILPNPFADGQPLRIFLENDFLGKVKIEVLRLDGQVVSVFEKEKTAGQAAFEIEKLPAGNAFFVRVSDGLSSKVQLVFKADR